MASPGTLPRLRVLHRYGVDQTGQVCVPAGGNNALPLLRLAHGGVLVP